MKRGVTPTIWREIRGGAGIEPVIGHNLHLLRAWLIRLLALLLSLLAVSATTAQMPTPKLAAR